MMGMDNQLDDKVMKYNNLKTYIFCWQKCAEKIKRVLQFLWHAYSTPTPNNWKELLVLFLSCLSICAIISGLLHNWMFSSLKYGMYISWIITKMFAIIMFLLLFIVHPMRCVFTIVIPTLGTKQGRDLLLSTCFMLVAVNNIPNMMGNIKMVLKLLQCVAVTSIDSLVNSTKQVEDMKDALVRELINVQKFVENKLAQSKQKWEFNSDFNQSSLKNHLQTIGNEIQSNISIFQTLLSEITLHTNRALAAFVFFYLAISSIRYLKGYLTNLEFDNVYITGKLTQLLPAKKGKPMLKRNASKTLIKSTGLKMSSDEVARCVKHMVLSTAYLALSIVIITTDFVIFNFTSRVLQLTVDIPPIPVEMGFIYKVDVETIIDRILNKRLVPIQLRKEANFPWNVTLVSDRCIFHPSHPNVQIIYVICLLYYIAYITVFLETYALRARRKISASFFEQREDERIKYLHQKLVKDSEHQFSDNIVVFTVSEQCHVSFKGQSKM
ncbi:osteoclast stimulatory transmembrane protein [Leucoraja erinacea]|uniref:osteoclast stimulatory transmembrane protein n=1 Tax=Leucoraja erinaceus TaxID=7782 RepID=UPI002454194C|nr:osteoclast stimulatory transmembrane protein [Leucoraja erinacea]